MLAKTAGGDGFETDSLRLHPHPVELRMCFRVGQHLGVGIREQDLGVEVLGAEDSEEPPSAAKLHHTLSARDRIGPEVLHEEVARAPDLIAEEARQPPLFAQGAKNRMRVLHDL